MSKNNNFYYFRIVFVLIIIIILLYLNIKYLVIDKFTDTITNNINNNKLYNKINQERKDSLLLLILQIRIYNHHLNL